MRVHETEGTNALFCGDILHGHLNECSSCGNKQEMTGEPGVSEYCSSCGVEIVYRPWCEW